MISSNLRFISTAISVIAAGLVLAPAAFAQPGDGAAVDPFAPGNSQAAGPQEGVAPAPAQGMTEVTAPASDDANPAAVAACAQFAEVLNGTATYYGQFADALETYENPDYSDPTISSSNELGRTALRQGAAIALTAANTPGLAPDIANPMRSWSLDATKLLLKMGLRGSGESLNLTVAELNQDATTVQAACAAAGTHA
ncbi:hypothetical protein A4X20_26935 [Mycolicibacterium iranicum]|uniref:Uncharacterized protein n=2 Tax=Mycolicibacterium iranicum TaxID=912594 RepID=A0A178LRR8_MYCIR|nr:hypothetical protein A4X20_26935 [Mycolicibacterium iranicum]